MTSFRAAELWERTAYDGAGHPLGRVEAVSTGRDRVPRKVGVRSRPDVVELHFVRLEGAFLEGGRLIVPAAPADSTATG